MSKVDTALFRAEAVNGKLVWVKISEVIEQMNNCGYKVVKMGKSK